MDFPQFLEAKFLEWQQSMGGRRSVSEFAKWIGVKQSSVSMWWTGANVPSSENVKRLADKLGLEVYDYLGIPRPDPNLHYIQQGWGRLSEKERIALREQTEKYIASKQKGK